MTDLRKKRGDSIELSVGPVLKPDGTVQDLAGMTLRFTAKDRYDDLDSAAVITGSTVDGRITITAPSTLGLATVVIPGSATAAFTDDRALVWDLQLASGATVVTLDSGTLIVERDVTRTAP